MADTLSEVKRLIKKYAKNQDALAEAGLESDIRKDLGVSSANLVDIVLDFESNFDLTVEDEELEGINTLGDAVRLIDGKLAAKAKGG